VTIIFTLAVSAFVVTHYIVPDPTCFDTKKNGFEVGIDCGGECSLMCDSDVVPLTVLWARALPTGTSTYDIVGLIENKNINNAPLDVPYTFTVFNKEGNQLFMYNGTTSISVDDDMPLVLQNILLVDAPYNTVLTLHPTKHYVTPEKDGAPPIKTLRDRYEEGDTSRVYVTIKNVTQKTFSHLPVRIILYDDNNNAIGVGETVVPYLNKEEQQELVFTWRTPFTVPIARTRVYYQFSSSQ
jgi:hypothetical protein